MRSSDPGNRCKLEPLHILLLTLIRKYANETQERLEDLFEVDQAAISKYLRLGNCILEAVLPTPKRFMALLKDTEEFKKIFPDGAILIMDEAHVRFRRPSDSGTHKDMYSDKTFTGNTILFVTPHPND